MSRGRRNLITKHMLHMDRNDHAILIAIVAFSILMGIFYNSVMAILSVLGGFLGVALGILAAIYATDRLFSGRK